MAGREFHDGATDGLEALEPLDPEKIHTFSELLEAMRKTAFGGRRLGEAFEAPRAPAGGQHEPVDARVPDDG